MNNLKIKNTQKTPLVILNKDGHFFKFSGISNMKNPEEFYTPIIKWIDKYNKLMDFISIYNNDKYLLKIDFEYIYFDSSSEKYIFKIMELIKESSMVKNIKVNINWFCDQENINILETGVHYKDKLQIPINFILTERIFSSIRGK